MVDEWDKEFEDGVERPVGLFHSGSQSCDWESRNCSNCKKQATDYDRFRETVQCELQYKISLAGGIDGNVTQAVAERVGYCHGAYTWDCPEKIPDELELMEDVE